jgi:hypothetical protein
MLKQRQSKTGSTMTTRPLGNGDFVVPRICLGTMTSGQQNGEVLAEIEHIHLRFPNPPP